jgi:hypothetical protein
MNKVLSIVLLTLGGTAAVIVLMGLILPRDYHAESSILINAPAAQIHGHVANFRKWAAWGNFTEQDPSLTFEYAGPESGIGAVRSWKGDRVGSGSLEIVESSPETGICFQQTTEGKPTGGRGCIRYAKEGGATRVTWTDQGELPPVLGGFFRSFVSQNLQGTFGIALGRLKNIVEGTSATAPEETAEQAAPEEKAPTAPDPELSAPQSE